MRHGWLIGAALGVGLCSQPYGEASAQKQTPTKQANPQPQPQPTELMAIKDAIERIARAQEAERALRDAEKQDTIGADDLRAQQSMAESAQWMLWPAWVGAIAGIAGVIALIGTFREQRKMTAVTTRARLAISDINAKFFDGKLALLIEISNAGPTDATNVKFKGAVFFDQKSDFAGALPEDEAAYQAITGELENVPANSTYFLPADGPLAYPPYAGEVAPDGSYIGPGFMLSGKITYIDTFGDRHAVKITAFAQHLTAEQYSAEFAFVGAHSIRRLSDGFQRELTKRKQT